MTTIVIVVFGIAVALFFAFSNGKKQSPLQSKETSAYRRRAVVNASELAMFDALQERLPEQVILLSAVRLADVIEPEVSKEQHLMAFRRISQKHLDLVVVERRSRMAVLAIEIDGPTHDLPRQKRSDKSKDEFLASAGIKLFRVKTNAGRDNSVLDEVVTYVRDTTLPGQVQGSPESAERLRTRKAFRGNPASH